MNAQRRKELIKAKTEFEAIQAQLADLSSRLTDFKDAVESVQSDEQEAFDNMPEGLQNGDRGAAAQETIDNLDSALTALDDLIQALDDVDSIGEYLDSAAA